MTTIAVTGASGFVGRHVLAALSERGIAVVATSRSGVKPAWSRARWIKLDVHEPKVEALDVLQRADAVIHLAWGGLPNYRSRHHIDVELPVQRAFMSELLQSGVHVVVAGTCLEYGLQEGELTEDAPTAPVTEYAIAKDRLRAELGVPRFTWARLFYMYGEGQSPSSLWGQLNAAVRAGRAELDLSGGEQVRDFLPAAEVGVFLAGLALQGAVVGVVNVCSGRPTTVKALVQRWCAENGWNIKLNFGVHPYPDYEPMSFWGSPAKLHGALA